LWEDWFSLQVLRHHGLAVYFWSLVTVVIAAETFVTYLYLHR